MGVVVVAAGQGVRAGGGTPKQFREVGGVPLLLRALRPFTSHPDVAHVVVVVPGATVAEPPGWLAGLAGGALSLVAGGVERTDSVRAGLGALPATCTLVLVHDGARPFADRGLVDAVIAAAREGDGAIPAIPLGDTLKEATADGARIARTLPRDRLWRAQTPQGFRREVLVAAYRHATSPASDDAALVEANGGKVRLVPGSSRNLKVTTPEDFALAEFLAAAGR